MDTLTTYKLAVRLLDTAEISLHDAYRLLKSLKLDGLSSDEGPCRITLEMARDRVAAMRESLHWMECEHCGQYLRESPRCLEGECPIAKEPK